jgi:hypothetical protein
MFWVYSKKSVSFFEDLLSQKESINFGWNFRHIVVTIRPLRGPNFWRIACNRLTSSKMAITREERPMGTNHSSLSRAYLMREMLSQKLFITWKDFLVSECLSKNIYLFSDISIRNRHSKYIYYVFIVYIKNSKLSYLNKIKYCSINEGLKFVVDKKKLLKTPKSNSNFSFSFINGIFLYQK